MLSMTCSIIDSEEMPRILMKNLCMILWKYQALHMQKYPAQFEGEMHVDDQL